MVSQIISQLAYNDLPPTVSLSLMLLLIFTCMPHQLSQLSCTIQYSLLQWRLCCCPFYVL